MKLFEFVGFNTTKTISDKLKSGEPLVNIEKEIKKERYKFNSDFKKSIKNDIPRI